MEDFLITDLAEFLKWLATKNITLLSITGKEEILAQQYLTENLSRTLISVDMNNPLISLN